ncbi:UDP-N-acetylmuramoyl-L-alanyl-D-glutamate--2,6-diaminopimelate ligase [Leptospira inadai serovar Lyme str. 10]|uniref:UDP-N-acetylmuramoyl-L-alanyl-D-glutamate--2,6-diaminopimelate ligase n=2 Tax=Leptospira inadai serovar Lyme TaxID=293084 RepID=V6HPH2_9LEPT|nr:UDP-N-acetylmuramoyl-L-alanyl-D-glutamate--2,6-diaminopimelate ligase [Leptospira inadai]EQA38765.1 UDP-N-acetylmuramoyl-L-alanyl-D-glutamate--2,6-diaminopimelate ligase [Leptospira inadai serovar Lyme str. 10]PNV74252.1 UDP-N-acetylmuramoyl-L-alanyl-D-glutamate--2,6-diaminopimelate ligase [Leptospira inadai serovar Lyme]
MKLSALLEAFPGIKVLSPSFDGAEEVAFVRTDSRQLSSRDLFCVPNSLGAKGIEYATESIGRFLLFQDGTRIPDLPSKIILTSPQDPEKYAGKIASLLLGNPSASLKVIGITGTNGKTSLTYILASLGQAVGANCGIIGTVGVRFQGKKKDTGYTTPDACSLQLILREMSDAGIEYVFMEASSHGLKLDRTDGVRFFAGVFTNLTQDHLDFHPNMEDYLRSKSLLFQSMKSEPNAFGVLDLSSPGGLEMHDLIRKLCPELKLFVIEDGSGELKISNEEFSLQGTEYDFEIPSRWGGRARIHTNLLGGFNIRNTALALTTAFGLGWPRNSLLEALRSIPQIPGRFQLYYSPDRSRMAVVDYAHTPDALENILKSVRESKPKELIVLFGCGGDRDRAKRPQMARIAERLADKVILTSDNPRTENPEAILDEIQSGFSPGFAPFLREADRAVAIRRGISVLEEGGCLLVAGKGHEDYQIIGKEKRHFDDGEEIQKAWLFTESGR